MRSQIPTYHFVSYYGFQEKKKVFETRKKCHYTLMPSRFLETFWLSALDSLSVGVPVIVPNKWWLAQFCIQWNQINLSKKPEDFCKQIQKIIENFNQEQWKTLSIQSQEIFQKYTKEKWISRFQMLSWLQPWAKILLVSDYIVHIWGIESYLFSIKSLLEDSWYFVEIIWCENKRLAYNRLVSMFGTFRNNKGANLFKKKIKEYKPDLVWRHSLQRWFGPLVLYEAKHCRSTQRVMYHDFWLFHPYPSKVYKEEQINTAKTFLGYMKEWIRAKWWQMPLQIIKRISSVLIKRQLKKNIDMHLVPSSYMEPLIYTQYSKLKKGVVKTLNHFA